MEEDDIEFYLYGWTAEPFAPKIFPPTISNDLHLIDASIGNVKSFYDKIFIGNLIVPEYLPFPSYPTISTEEKIVWLDWVTNILYINNLILLPKPQLTMNGKPITIQGYVTTT